MATLEGIRESMSRSEDPVTGLITETDPANIVGTVIQVAEVKSLNPPLVELLDGSTVEITARVVGQTVAIGDLVLVLKVARWFIAVGEVEAI